MFLAPEARRQGKLAAAADEAAPVLAAESSQLELSLKVSQQTHWIGCEGYWLVVKALLPSQLPLAVEHHQGTLSQQNDVWTTSPCHLCIAAGKSTCFWKRRGMTF